MAGQMRRPNPQPSELAMAAGRDHHKLFAVAAPEVGHRHGLTACGKAPLPEFFSVSVSKARRSLSIADAMKVRLPAITIGPPRFGVPATTLAACLTMSAVVSSGTLHRMDPREAAVPTANASGYSPPPQRRR